MAIIQPPYTNFQYFPEDYFTGTEMSVFFGDTEIKEVSALSVVVQEQLQPVYGFQSFTPNAFMRGARLVSGQLVIPYMESNWLHRILAQERAKRQGVDSLPQAPWTPSEYEEQAYRGSLQKVLLETNNVNELATAARRWPIEVLREVARMRQESAWQQAAAQPDNTSPLLASSSYNRPLFQADDPEGFDIILVTGVPSPSRMNLSPYAVSMIQGVQLASRGIEVANNDQVLMEVYTFQAKDLDGPLFALS